MGVGGGVKHAPGGWRRRINLRAKNTAKSIPRRLCEKEWEKDIGGSIGHFSDTYRLLFADDRVSYIAIIQCNHHTQLAKLSFDRKFLFGRSRVFKEGGGWQKEEREQTGW